MAYMVDVKKKQKAHGPYSKYQFMEVNNQRRSAGLKDKIPDIEKTLETVKFLKKQKVWQEAGSFFGLLSDGRLC